MQLNQEQFAKACECKTAEELIAYAKELGFDLPKDAAEKFLAQVADQELNVNDVENVAGGLCAAAISIGCLGPGVA